MSYYENIYCSECGLQVCQTCGCCYNSSCKMCCCPTTRKEIENIFEVETDQ